MNDKMKAELDAIREENPDGLLRVDEVYNFAKRHRKSSAIGASLTWDNNKAAESWRKHEIRHLIRTYHVIVSTADNRPIKTRAYVSVTTDRNPSGGYRFLPDVLDDDSMRRQLLADALAELERFEAKYRRLTEIGGVLREIDRFRDAIQSEESAAAES